MLSVKKKVRFSALVTKEAAFYRDPGQLTTQLSVIHGVLILLSLWRVTLQERISAEIFLQLDLQEQTRMHRLCRESTALSC